MESDAGTSLVEPMGRAATTSVCLMENHDEAYYFWRRIGVLDRTLVHVDAHHDMAWLDDPGQLNIGNYICQAIKDGMVTEVIWVVPDASWTTRGGRANLRRHLNALARHYAGRTCRIVESARRLSTRLRTVPITICALESLPRLTGPVILDIDVDFFMLSAVEYARNEKPGEYPWLWPADFVAMTEQESLKPEIVTIAYSVAGGYVPMKWKYLGDELALAWQCDSPASSAARLGFRLLRSASDSRTRGDRATAIEKLEQAALCLPGSAAPRLHLALLHLESGNADQARTAFREAARRDASYAGAHASRGFVCLSEGENDEARDEFQRVLALDPANPFGILGLARVAALRRKWPDAAHLLKVAIDIDPRLIDAHRYLGDALVKMGREEEAAAAYSRSLKLALEGELSIEEAVHTVASPHPRDGRHDRFHAALANIDLRAGRVAEAIAGYRMAVAAREDRVWLRIRLAGLYLRQGWWPKAAREIQIALSGAARRAWRSVQRKRPTQR